MALEAVGHQSGEVWPCFLTLAPSTSPALAPSKSIALTSSTSLKPAPIKMLTLVLAPTTSLLPSPVSPCSSL